MSTYAGAYIAVADGKPSSYDESGYNALSFITGQCALWECPKLARTWGTDVNRQVGCETDRSYKTKATWSEVLLKFSDVPSDAAQAIYASLARAYKGIGSFKLVLPADKGTFFFTARVTKFTMLDGGDKQAIMTRSGVLLIQSNPVYIASPPVLVPAFRVDTTSYTVDSTVITSDRIEAA